MGGASDVFAGDATGMVFVIAAPRFTAPTNVSLVMLVEMVLGPSCVWLGTGERPSPIMLVGAAIVLFTLASFIVATGLATVCATGHDNGQLKNVAEHQSGDVRER